MLFTRYRIVPLFFTLALFVNAGNARADYVTATLSGTNPLGPDSPVLINLGNGTAPNISYTPGFVNWTGNTSNSSLGYNFTTFCLELTQDIYAGQTYTYNLTPVAQAPTPGSSQNGNGSGMGTTKANEIGLLWGGFYNQLTDPNAGVNAAAFQLAIWKIEYDWGTSSFDNFSAGNFRASDTHGAVTQATTWLDAINNNPGNYTAATNLIALTNANAQDQIAQTIVPVPPTLCLAVIGGATLLATRLRRRQLAL